MRGVFSSKIQEQIEEQSIFRKLSIRVFTLSTAIWLVFSAISYSFFSSIFLKFSNRMYLSLMIIEGLFVFIGCITSLLVFNKIIAHIKRIILELTNNVPNWEILENDYIESDIKSLYLTIKNLHSTVTSQSKLVGLAQVASQVAHDIRSPLAALELIIKDMVNIPEYQRIILRNSMNRIYDIANNLLMEYRNNVNAPSEKIIISSEMVSLLILNIVSEKRIQYSKKSIEFSVNIADEARETFANVDVSEFKRAISNLLNNAVESLAESDNKQVIISVYMNDKHVFIEIKDHGCGIDKEMLIKINNLESCTSKINGFGFGLTHAIKFIKIKCGGQFKIDSKLKNGTSVIMGLPSAEPPRWFCPKINIWKETIIILDDDQTIHDIWQRRVQIKKPIRMINFYNSKDFIEWVSNNDYKNAHFLIDFELINSLYTGLEVIKKFEIYKDSILVTSRHEDLLLRKECESLGITIIPKEFSPYIPIEVSEAVAELIFLDDYEPLTEAWKNHANRLGKKIDIFNKGDDLLAQLHTYKKDTKIYIDSDLGISYMRGEALAKILYDKGYTELYLSTGTHYNDVTKVPWIKAVVGKKPPF